MDRRIVTLISASALLAAIVVIVLVAGGGSDDKKSDTGDISTDLKTKPVITASTEKPAGLESTDVVEGTGPAAKTGDNVSVQYVGAVTATGKEFDSSWSRDSEPFAFDLGTGGVIAGWDQGIPGMKVGGRRVLVIPSDLAYGAAGSPPDIPANADLTFVVDLEAIK